MDQAAREERLKSFRNGKASYLIVTDLAARGIDIPLLNNVINLHFPMSPKLFVHRCGRVARQAVELIRHEFGRARGVGPHERCLYLSWERGQELLQQVKRW